MELKIRVSQLHRIMSASGKLTQTNKTYIEECAIYDLFGIKEHVSTKPMQKGIILEQEAIDLVNRNEFTNYEKSDKRGDLGWMIGHPDTITGDVVIDWKAAWHAKTFAWTKEEMDAKVKKSGYDWQIRGYMMLFNLEKGKVCDVLLSTPESLLTAWDDLDLHQVNHIPESSRYTFSSWIDRDLDIEEEIKEKYKICNEYYKEYIELVINKNK